MAEPEVGYYQLISSYSNVPYLVDIGVVEVAEPGVGPQHYRSLGALQLVLRREDNYLKAFSYRENRSKYKKRHKLAFLFSVR